jgi:hypothetical protein
LYKVEAIANGLVKVIFLSYIYVYKINMNIKYVILGCVLVLFILIATGISCGALPYSSTTVYAKYEGFVASTFNAKLT